ncbi:MAG: TIGR02300 family protein [Hyphomicrobium sp.]|nr:TIGR02300 family protein [Hyphomicrobium sp.]
MSMKAARGTKRTCQNNECGARFYDLSRSPIVCPVCASIYVLASSPLAQSIAEDRVQRPKPKKPEPVEKPMALDTEAVAEGDEALVDLEDAEDIPADEDETFLEEEEEEGGDVSNIIGGSVAEGDEEET